MRYLTCISVAALSIATACGSSSGQASGLCAENGVTTTIEDNHPNGFHVFEVPVADVTAGVEKTYDIQGNNTGHGHTVTVTAENFEALDTGVLVSLTSSDTGAVGMDHTHPVTLSCSP